ncbi:hypothetical protein [Candidatus Enterococcus mansonii]|uniref:Uncharacterized protein n=1 Tax=Candidatus Enterococcus mansonii TaxID=1834181 RepID=A0A242C5F9_9ENTE|nr:hypothetical protein [Enterococcus sp. 4G2_DIV0659]OTO05494.1 hypothetical protein A5880_002667 [Enterococcus sp. 4G2_DIV0659]
MWSLWREFSKESRGFWLFSGTSFFIFSGYMFYRLGIQKESLTGIPQVLLVVLLFFLFFHLVWELSRQTKAWRESHYRLLPINVGTFYFSNILFSCVTTMVLLLIYYSSFVVLMLGLKQQLMMKEFQEYWKHLLVGGYFFLSLSIYFQFVYLLSCTLSERVSRKFQKLTKYTCFFVFIILEIIMSNKLLTIYRESKFVGAYQIEFKVGYVPLYLSDVLFDVITLSLSSIACIFILKNYIEAERR